MQSNSAPATALVSPLTMHGPWLWPLCILFFAVVLLVNPNYRWADERSTPLGADFVQEWVAGDMLLSGAADRIYDRQAFQAWQHDSERLGFTWSASQYYPAVYPPPYYCLTAPLACLPYRVSVIAWLFTLVMAYGLAAHCAMSICAKPLSNRLQWFWCLSLLLPAMFLGCVLGQKGSLWLFVISVSVTLLKGHRPLLAGCVASLLTLKPTLCVLLPAFMCVTGQWRFVGGFVIGFGSIYGSTALCVPYSMWNDYLQVVSSAAAYQGHAGYRTGWSTSISTILSSLAVEKSVGLGLLAFSAIAWLVSCVVQARRSPEAMSLTRPECLWQVLAGTALISPHAYFYDLTWLLLPLSYWLASQPRRALRNLAIVWIGMFLGQTFEYGPALPALALLCTIPSTLRPSRP